MYQGAGSEEDDLTCSLIQSDSSGTTTNTVNDNSVYKEDKLKDDIYFMVRNFLFIVV